MGEPDVRSVPGPHVGVSDALCDARMATLSVMYNTMAGNIEETRKGIGKLIQVVCEGNGNEALTVCVQRTAKALAEHLEEHKQERAALAEAAAAAQVQAIEDEKERKKERRNRRWVLGLALGGWGFTTVLWVLSRFVPSA